MGNDEAGAICQQLLECLLDLTLCPRVDTAGGLVQNENSRVGKRHASDRKQLSLPLTEPCTTFSQDRLSQLDREFTEGVRASLARKADSAE